MKHFTYLIILSLSLSNFSGMTAQTIDDCATVISDKTLDDIDAIINASNTRAPITPIVVNIYFWVVNKTDGTNEYQIGETEVLKLILRINKAFNPHGIYFKFKGYDNTSFNNTNHYSDIAGVGPTAHFANLVNFAKSNNNQFFKTDALNCFIPRDMGFASGIAQPAGEALLIISPALDRQVISHELGHNLGLPHTFRGYDSSNCERVTRDPNDPSYNADTAGDRIIDTAACHDMSDINQLTCEYDGNATDCGGTPYQLFSVDEQNFMSYTYDSQYPNNTCRTMFSDGQRDKMRDVLMTDPSLSATINTVESLYKPFKGVYNPNTNEIDAHFQPGFDYQFRKCDCTCPEPTDYNDLNFTYSTTTQAQYSCSDLGPILHPVNSAILIEQIDPIQPRHCYSNGGSSNIVGGTITTFHDGNFTPNATTRAMTKEELQQDEIMECLANGLYKLVWVFENGYREERVVNKRQ